MNRLSGAVIAGLGVVAMAGCAHKPKQLPPPPIEQAPPPAG